MTIPISLTRRRFFVGSASLIAAGLAGCSNSPVGRTVATYWDQRGGGDRFTRAQVEQLPYAALAAGVGDGARAMLVLVRAEGEDLHWVTADKVILVTRRGRLIKTVGLAAVNLANTTLLDPDPLGGQPDLWKTPHRLRRTVDLGSPREFGITLVAEWQPGEIEEIATFHGARQALRVKERCHAPHAGWALDNTFWLDPATGAVLSSIQHIAPDAPPMRLELLKPYRA